jgi:hypothetical protein
MSEPMIRGHVIAHTARFVRAHVAGAADVRLQTLLSGELKAVLAGIAPAHWYPRRHQVELLRALGDVCGGAEAAYVDLVLCGSALAAVDNPFMRLLMRVMTPDLFVTKLPLFWQRDHQSSGVMTLKSFDGKHGRLVVSDIAGYDHAAVVWLGWIKQILTGLSAGKAEVDQVGWTAARPGPQEVSYEMSWS